MKRTTKECNDIAHNLLSGEFENFANNPADYCRAMGWHKDSKGTKKAIKKGVNLVWDGYDTEALASIIKSQGNKELIEIVESGSVSDFLCNCVAKHIQA